jgi:hypothetical protein
MQRWKGPLTCTLALTLGAAPFQSGAAAAPAPMPPGVAKAEAARAVTQVRRYRSFHRHHGHHRHGHRGRNLAIGLGIGIIGGMIAAEAYRGSPGYYDDAEACDGLPPGYAGEPRAGCPGSRARL